MLLNSIVTKLIFSIPQECWICINLNMYMCMYIYIYIYTYVCLYIYLHIHVVSYHICAHGARHLNPFCEVLPHTCQHTRSNVMAGSRDGEQWLMLCHWDEKWWDIVVNDEKNPCTPVFCALMRFKPLIEWIREYDLMGFSEVNHV